MRYGRILHALVVTVLLILSGGKIQAGTEFQITATVFGSQPGTGSLSTVGICNEFQQVNCNLDTFSFPTVLWSPLTDPAGFVFSDGPGGPVLHGYGGTGYLGVWINEPDLWGNLHVISEVNYEFYVTWSTDDPNDLQIVRTSNDGIVPEPLPAALLAAGLVALAGLRRTLLRRR